MWDWLSKHPDACKCYWIAEHPELLFDDVRCLMKTVYSESLIDSKIHCLIRTLENVKRKVNTGKTMKKEGF
jgi:hypothetical protein